MTNKEKIKVYKGNYNFVYAEYIQNGKSTYTLAEEWQLPKSSVYSILKFHNLIGIKITDRINSCEESKFNIKNPIFCYLAGLISADGYIDNANHRVVIRMNYNDWYLMLNKIRDYFSISNTVKEYSGKGGYANGYRMADLTISSVKLIDELAKLRIVGRKKDLGVRFPNMDMLSDECQEMFMRGLIDGDGCIREDNGGLSILEESDLMMEAIRTFINNKFSLDYEFYSTTKYKSIYIWKKDTISIYKWLYRHNLEFKLEYKYARALG